MVTSNEIDEMLDKLIKYARKLGIYELDSFNFYKNRERDIRELKEKIENTKNEIKKAILNETFDTF